MRVSRAADIRADPRFVALFSQPPERFVLERDALARILAASRHPGSSIVQALPRPTREVWLLNRLARERSADLAELFEAGGRLRGAHAAAIHGRPGPGMRAADEAVSHLLDRLLEGAGRWLAEEGRPPSPALLFALRSDLRALAAAGGEAAERLRAGTLERVPRASADEQLAAALRGPAPPARRGARPAGGGAGRSAAEREGRQQGQERSGLVERRTRGREVQRARRALMAAEKELARREAAAARAARAAGRLRDEAEAASVLAERERRARDGAIAARDAARASVAAVERGLGIR